MRSIIYTLLALTLSGPLAAQEVEVPTFDDYAEMRATLDEHIRQIEIVDAFGAMLPPNAAPADRLAEVEELLKSRFPGTRLSAPLEEVAVIVDEPGENGFGRQIIAYWTETDYLYVHITFHNRGDDLVVFQLNINSVLAELLANF